LTRRPDAFLDELIQKTSPAYAIFRTAGPEATKLVDVLVAEQLSVPGGFPEATAMGPEAIGLWGETLASARPYRKAMQMAADRFPAWWEQATEDQRKAMREYLPRLAPAAGELGDGCMRDLIGGGAAALRCASTYALTTPDAPPAIAGIVRQATGDDAERDRLLDALVDAFPASRMEESRDAERLLPVLARAVTASGEAWAPAMRLAILLIANDPSSAYGALKSLPAALAKVDSGSSSKADYLDQFISLVESLGNRVVGASLDKLPRAADARAMVRQVTETTRAYGAEAGARLLQRSL
jgi:hypothetical protein